MTIGEIKGYVDAVSSQRRADRQAAAQIAYIQAGLTIRFLNGGRDVGSIFEEFPGLWTDEEIMEAKAAEIERKMQRWQQQKVVKK